MAALVLLKDRGHCPNVRFGDDEDSQRFVHEVRKTNQSWEPGRRPTVPAPTTQAVKAPVIAAPTDTVVAARPRERRARRVARTTGSRGDPDPEPEPPLKVIPLAAFRREVNARLLLAWSRSLGGVA
jgi:hypothetical protein